MIKERIPGLAILSEEDKWQLMAELEEELMAANPTSQEPLKSEIVSRLEERYQDYIVSPDQARSWAEVSQKMRPGS